MNIVPFGSCQTCGAMIVVVKDPFELSFQPETTCDCNPDARRFWRPVPSHPRYSVDLYGNVRGVRGRLMKPMRTDTGHLYILAASGRPRKLFVHRAVLLTFVGKPARGQEARHRDGNPTNNYVDNLVWGTRLENMADKQTHGTQSRGERHGTAKLSETDVRTIRRRVGKESLRDLAAEYGVSHTAIRRAANGMKWRHV